MSLLAHQLKPRAHAAPAVPADGDEAFPGASLSGASSRAIKRESRITLAGLVYIAVTIFLAIGAINSQNNLLFWLFGVAIATLIVSGLFSGNALMQIRLEAQAIPDARAGEPLRLHYLVTNRSKFFPLFAALISEIPDDHHPAGQIESASVLHLGPRQRARVTGSLTASDRGRHALGRVRLTTRFPFGLLQKGLVFECHRPMMTLPYQLGTDSDLVRLRRGRGEEVLKRAKSTGVSSEYWGLREYKPGDSKRSIAWKQSARNRQLVVIQHAQPIATRLWVWITDPGGDPARDNPHERRSIERAIALSASLVEQATRRGTPIGLWAPAWGMRLNPGVGRAHMLRCLRTLAMLDVDVVQAGDSAPAAAETDHVLVITRADRASTSARLTRTVNPDAPETWMKDAALLPDALRSPAGGGA